MGKIPSILVIGAGGFIGSRVARALYNQGLSISSVIREGNASKILPTFLVPDLTEPNALQSILERTTPEYVINAAGVIPQSRSVSEPGSGHIIATNIAQSLLNFSPESRLIHFGSAAEYGSGNRAFREGDDPKPNSAYGLDKLRTTKQLEQMFSNSDSKCIVIRPPTVYGSRQSSGMLVPTLLRHFQSRTPITLSSPSAGRDYLHVDDLSNGIYKIILSPNQNNFDIINIGTGVTTLTKDVVWVLAQILNIPELTQLVDYASEFSVYDPDKIVLDIEKIRREHKFTASRNLASGFREMVQDLKND